MTLGYLTWWTVGSPTLTDQQAHDLVLELLPEAKPPAVVLPHDAFRRVTGEDAPTDTYELAHDQTAVLSIQATGGSKNTFGRVVIRTVRRGRSTIRVDKVADIVFYKPPRNEHDKARFRFTVVPEATRDPDIERIRAFGEAVRERYRNAQRHLDGQAVRRVVRSYLAAIESVSLDGMHLIDKQQDAQRLSDFLDRIGNASCRFVAVADTPLNRRQLGRQEV